VPRLSAERRAIKLAWLAREVIAHPEEWHKEAVQILLGAWADDSLDGEALDHAFVEYAETVRLVAGVADGTVSWQDVTHALEGTDRQEAACRITGELAARALAVLVNGDGRNAVAAPVVTAIAPPAAAPPAHAPPAHAPPAAAPPAAAGDSVSARPLPRVRITRKPPRLRPGRAAGAGCASGHDSPGR
jgi:hypothetical protein